MSDSDNDIFITQSTFSKSSVFDTSTGSSDADNASDAAAFLLSIGDQTLDAIDRDLVSSNPQQTISQVLNPEYSDISDAELVSTCEKVEQQEESHVADTKPLNRFGSPVKDSEVQLKGRKR